MNTNDQNMSTLPMLGIKGITHAAGTHLGLDVSDIADLLSRNGHTDGKKLAVFAIKHAVRRTLPYGIWTCDNDRIVIFNREYQPILEKNGDVKSHVDRNAWIENIVAAQYLYDDACSPIDYLTKHLGQPLMSAADTRACKKSLLICLKVLRAYTPEEHGSVNRNYSMFRMF